MIKPNHFELLRSRPSMYISKPSLECLQCFISGCAIVEETNNIPNDKRFFQVDWRAFDAFVLQKAKETIRNKCRKANEAILAMCNNDDKEAFYFFFQLLDEFKEQK